MTDMEDCTASMEDVRYSARRSICRHCVCSTLCSNAGVCLVLLAYILVGAVVFRHVEGDAETRHQTSVETHHRNVEDIMLARRRAAVEKLWEITITLNVLHKQNWTALTFRELARFQQQLLLAVTDNSTTAVRGKHQRWSFCSSLLYCLTVITTIGCGSNTPRTDMGKLLTIGYAIVGIPLMLLYLSNVGDVLARALKAVLGGCCFCSKRRQHKRSPPDVYDAADFQHHSDGQHRSRILHVADPSSRCGSVYNLKDDCAAVRHVSSQPTDAPLRHNHLPPPPPPHLGADLGWQSYSRRTQPSNFMLLFTACLLAIVGYIIAGGFLLTQFEDWSQLDATYFCFVSLVTIGFGQLTPGATDDSGAWSSQLVAAIYLLVGMALIAMCFNLMQEQVVSLVQYSTQTSVSQDSRRRSDVSNAVS